MWEDSTKSKITNAQMRSETLIHPLFILFSFFIFHFSFFAFLLPNLRKAGHFQNGTASFNKSVKSQLKKKI
jgi:hypothetical protein